MQTAVTYIAGVGPSDRVSFWLEMFDRQRGLACRLGTGLGSGLAHHHIPPGSGLQHPANGAARESPKPTVMPSPLTMFALVNHGPALPVHPGASCCRSNQSKPRSTAQDQYAPVSSLEQMSTQDRRQFCERTKVNIALVASQVLLKAASGVPGKHRCLVRVTAVRPEVPAMTSHWDSVAPSIAAGAAFVTLLPHAVRGWCPV